MAGKITLTDFGTMSWLSRRAGQVRQEAELTFYKGEAEKMANEIETMIDELKQGNSIILAGMTIRADPK